MQRCTVTYVCQSCWVYQSLIPKCSASALLLMSPQGCLRLQLILLPQLEQLLGAHAAAAGFCVEQLALFPADYMLV